MLATMFPGARSNPQTSRSPNLRGRGLCLAFAFVLTAVLFSSGAASAEFDVRTQGGLRPGTRVIHVTSLADNGPGSLREALEATGPRIVVFDVGGYIELQSDLQITAAQLTIAGQTAPDPGIVLRGASVRIRAGDVVMEHIGVFPGPSNDAKINGGRDAISLIGSVKHHHPVHGVILRNVSLGWATDENLSFAGDDTSNVVVEHSLIAKGLRRAGHPKGVHSMGLLVSNGVKNAAIVGNILAFNNRRNPHISQGSEVYFANNFVYGYGERSVEVYRGVQKGGPLQATIVSNVFVPSADTQCSVDLVLFQTRFIEESPGAQVYLKDNVVDQSRATPSCPYPKAVSSKWQTVLAGAPPVRYQGWHLAPTDTLRQTLLRSAGMRPGARTPIDRLIIQQIESGAGHLIDSPSEDGGWPPLPAAPRRVAQAPVASGSGDKDVAALAAWLCSSGLAVGGAPYAGCKAH